MIIYFAQRTSVKSNKS